MPRLFRSHTGYVAMVTGVLGVAVGADLVLFTVINALWIRPLPFPEPDRLVTLPQAKVTSLEGTQLGVFEGRVAGQVFTADAYGAFRPRIEIGGSGQELETLGVTSGYFSLFGLVVRGRDFTLDDDRDNADPVAIISDRFWSRAFDRRLDVIGAVVPGKPISVRVVGVAPPGFQGARRGERADIWIPAALLRRLAVLGGATGTAPMMVFARLGPGQTVAMIDQRHRELLDPRTRELLQKNTPSPLVVPMSHVFGTPDTRTFVVSERNGALIAAGLGTLVLLGGCVTIAALVLVHYERRRSELALKICLGAGRLRLVRELLHDLLLVALTGSAVGIVVAYFGVRVLPAITLPGGVDIGRLDLSIDWRVCAAAITATVVTLLAGGTLPLIRSTSSNLLGQLFTGSSSTLASQRIRQVLLGVQVCATMIVLVAAGLFVRAVAQGFGNAPGFDIDRTVFVSVQEGDPQGSVADWRVPTGERVGRLMRALRELPGVNEVAEGMPPIGPDARVAAPLTVKVEGKEHQLIIGLMRGSPELLSVFDLPILAGRHLTSADASTVPVPAVITRSLAERLWQGEALGRTLTFPQMRGGPYLVVGVTRDLAFGSLGVHSAGVVVTAQPILNAIVASFVIRTDQPEQVVGSVRRELRGQVVKVATGREVVARDLGRQRLGAWFFSGFGLAALLLGVGGAFGLVAYLAETRRREFGIRLALGATTRHLVRQGLIVALVPVSAGVVAGLILASLVSQLFTALLAGVSAIDSVSYLGGAVAVLGSATVAALAAAWRLRRFTPSSALRTT